MDVKNSISTRALASTLAYEALQSHYKDIAAVHMRDLFAAEPDRGKRMSLEAAQLVLDYAKNRINATTLHLLFNLARACQIEAQRAAMLNGEIVNFTERRPALHTALRAPNTDQYNLCIDGQYINQDVHTILERMQYFVACVHRGQWRGYTGKPISDIVHIGTGGSSLGPQMVCTALRHFIDPRFSMHFVSNVDGHDLAAVLEQINAETTLFIIVSKTFATQETIMNARSARDWFIQQTAQQDLSQHFIAVSVNIADARAFGCNADSVFPFWDWVGGRYSLWSAVGLSIALAIGFDRFTELLAGAHAMDLHFQQAPLEQNMPIILALIGIWNRHFCHSTSLAVVPYHQDLSHLPAYLQQLEMESNGKCITRAGTLTAMATCPVLWGGTGTNSQHAFFQLLHQGTDVIPIDFIAVLKPTHGLAEHHAALLANCFAQAKAYLYGNQQELTAMQSHKMLAGNRPSNMIVLDALTPTSLGALIALYEHKTFVQGTIWDINSFDQWGVELGKAFANQIQAELLGALAPQEHDSSTKALIARARLALCRGTGSKNN